MSVLDTIKKRQLLRGVALDVYEIITGQSNLTAGEIAKKYEARRPKFKRGRNEIAKRVRDLEVWGAVKKTGVGVCRVTGKNVAIYAITGNIPTRTSNAANKEIAAPKTMNAEMTRQVAVKETHAPNEKVGALLTVVIGGENHFQTLRKLQAEKVKKVRSFFVSKARRAELKRELDAIEYMLNTASYIKDLGSMA